MSTRSRLNLLVVSHACVVAANQEVFLSLRDRGFSLKVVVPHRWRDDYRENRFRPNVLKGMEDAIIPVLAVGVGRPQRHAYFVNMFGLLRRLRPDLVLIEEESFSLAALEWGLPASLLGLKFGVQAAETLDRNFPMPIRKSRSQILARSSFVMARSPASEHLVKTWGARGEVALVPHAVPPWPKRDRTEGSHQFTVGFAGRLVPQKGLHDLVRAVASMQTSSRLLIVGDGPMRHELEGVAPWVDIVVGARHEEMDQLFAKMDVLVLPSHSTRTWEEQFGRVLVEALWCGTPVVGAESGQIPWVINTTGGGSTYPVGDVSELSRILDGFAIDPFRRRLMAIRGRAAVEAMFSSEAVASTLADVLFRARDRPLGNKGGLSV